MQTDEIEKLLAEATPGPWNARSPSIPDYYGSIIGRGATETGWPVVGDVCLRTESGSSEANAHLIAMAPDLAAEALRLRAENERLTEATLFARNRLEAMCDEAWNGDARDFKRSLSGVFAEFDEAVRAALAGKDG